MKTDPVRLRDDPASPEGLRELMSHGSRPPRIDAAAKAASAAAVATLAGGTAAAASATVVGGAKLWLILGGLTVAGIVAAVAITDIGEGADRGDTSEGNAAHAAQVSGEATGGAIRPVEAPVSIEPPVVDEGTDIAPDRPATSQVGALPAAPRTAERSARSGRAAPTADTLVLEANMLEQARRMLAVDPAGALAQTNTHAREHPRGQLAAEREVIAIDALRRLHRPAQARTRARRLIENAPGGIYAERARAVLGELSQDGVEP